MNILLTGAGGFIGSHLHKKLNSEHKVFQVFHSSDYIERKNSFSVNLTNVSAVNKLIKDLSKQQKIDAIIHLASAMASSDKINDVRLLNENILIIENVINIAKSVKPKIFINFSSMAVYPNISGNFSEDSLPKPQKNPDCIYGLSKYCSEVMIDFLLRNENISIVHLRISQVHGKNMRTDRIIPVMLKELKDTNTITVYGDGERTSNFINVDKLVKKVEFFIQEDIIYGTYNVGDRNISFLELAQGLIDKYGDENSTINKEPQGNKEKFILDISKLKSVYKN
tara:strand:+ start:29549 stop:30394 length:846 start_codon:yes stop_codon:yes gene_type:complete